MPLYDLRSPDVLDLLDRLADEVGHPGAGHESPGRAVTTDELIARLRQLRRPVDDVLPAPSVPAPSVPAPSVPASLVRASGVPAPLVPDAEPALVRPYAR